MKATMNLLSVATLACLGFASARAAEEIKVIEHATTDFTTDLGAKGDSVGDILTFANPLFATDDKTEAGKDQGFCLRVAVGQAWYCQFTNILKDGQLMVAGPFNDKGDSVMAVTGGSGKYLGARGTMTLHARDAKGTAFDFTFKLL